MTIGPHQHEPVLIQFRSLGVLHIHEIKRYATCLSSFDQGIHAFGVSVEAQQRVTATEKV